MSFWVVVLFVAAAWFVLRYVKVSVRAPATMDQSSGPRPAIEPPPDVGNDTDEYDIVGESHYQSALLELFGPKREHGISESCAAVLIAERTYMRRQNVRSIRVVATVSGGWRDSKSGGYYGVRVEVPAELIDA